MEDLQLAGARVLLAALRQEPDLAHGTPLLRRTIAPAIVQAIADAAREYRAYNRDMKSGGGALLSGSAQEYWDEARAMLKYSQLVHANGEQGGAEKALSKKCERLEETFEQRVGQAERGMFLIYEVDGSVWDDRWHACVDWFPPILRTDLGSGHTVANPMRQAQLDVLTALLEPPAITEVSGKQNDGSWLREIAREPDR